MPFYNRQSQKVFPLLTPIVSASELLLTREGTKVTSCRHLEKEWKQQMRKKASNLHYLARLCKKNKCQLECWNLMDGVVYCPFFPFYKHHASVKEKSFCIGDVLQGPIFQIVHSCWRSIWIHLWPPSSPAPTKIISYHLYLLVVLTYLVEISLS